MSSLRQHDQDLTSIAGLQKFDGQFALDQRLANLVGISITVLEQEATKRSWNRDAWATTVVLAYFVARLNSIAADWELIADKSKSWLSQYHESISEDMFEAALNLYPG